MYSTLSLDEFVTMAQHTKRIAMHKEISADFLTPIQIVENLKEEMKEGVILESGLHHQDAGRYSYLAFGALANFTIKNQAPNIGNRSAVFDPFRKLLKQYACLSSHPQVNLMNGAVGFLTYDAIRLFEVIPDRHNHDQPLPDISFQIYETVLMFDHLKQTVMISINVEVGQDPSVTYQATEARLSNLITQMSRPTSHDEHHTDPSPSLLIDETDVTDEIYVERVERAKEYIAQGDAFQIVLSRCFQKNYTTTPFHIYRTLRRTSPAPYMFYLTTPQGVIVGASPEKMIQIRDQRISINPIAGTRRREKEDDKGLISAALLNNEKERAEHMMLVDLARNDLGIVCKPGSIQIDELLHVKHYSHISHLTSEISGTLRDDCDAFDVLTAVFPAGTLSGAPKIRAMEIIDELESSKRGMYGGVICRVDFQGNLDSCIAIRMATLNKGVASIRAGAGIVFDSDPMSEANETRQKAQGILEAISLAEESLT